MVFFYIMAHHYLRTRSTTAVGRLLRALGRGTGLSAAGDALVSVHTRSGAAAVSLVSARSGETPCHLCGDEGNRCAATLLLDADTSEDTRASDYHMPGISPTRYPKNLLRVPECPRRSQPREGQRGARECLLRFGFLLHRRGLLGALGLVRGLRVDDLTKHGERGSVARGP